MSWVHLDDQILNADHLRYVAIRKSAASIPGTWAVYAYPVGGDPLKLSRDFSSVTDARYFLREVEEAIAPPLAEGLGL